MTSPANEVDEIATDEATHHSTGPSTAVVSKSPTRIAMERFRKDKLSMTAFSIVVFFFVAAVLAPILVKTGVLDPFGTNQDLLNEFSLPSGKWGGMSSSHPLGLEPGVGRDALSRVWYGITFSLAMSISATIIAIVLGVVLGIVSGASGGWADTIIGRLIDLTLSFPQTLMLLALSSVLVTFISDKLHVPSGNPSQAVYVVAILGLFGWTGIARLVRGQVLSLREAEFVQAANLMGASRARIYFKEILPNLWAPILVSFTLIMPTFVSAEAALGYLGVSIGPPTPTLGTVLNDSLSYADTDPLYFFVPAVTIMVIVVSFNLLGDGLRDALDPKGNR
ncbi:ABC transporter permease [Nocardioides acrostichi]|uniref:ABC transporter permease n=1 Tax=Nocardioides acrostichi TaxID=2784339 RepID=A0A930UYR6_9ACTN|nr:ABC transporter permease [Nocardioides acrostichi]MBF4162192.1 ABC transporter permease [Nocardioides acrostichi]